jgi:hypothetical protein
MLTKGQIGFLNEHTRGKWSLNLSTGLVDIVGDFDCSLRAYTDFGGIRFGRVSGYFDCSRNFLKTLEGSPREVGGYFDCDSNSLTTLVGAPQKVEWGFYCDRNDLTTLEGAPQTIGGKFSSDLVVVPKGLWSIQDLSEMYEMYKNSEGKRKDLLGTLVSPEALQKRIDSDPEKAAVELKSIVGLPEYQCLRWPDGLQSEVDLLSDLDRIGQ